MSYRALARSAPVIFFVLGVFARLPYAITPLGSLLLLQHATGSHTFAGVAAGAQSIAIAVAGFAAGALAARFGARRLGMTLAILNAFAAVLLAAASMTASRPAMVGGAVLVGITQPHVGLLVRVHWSHTLGRGTAILRTAFGYESAVDELSFVIGPATAALFAAPWPGAGPLLGMALLLLGSSLPFASMYTDRTPERQGAAGRLPVRRMASLVVSMAALGAIFGSIQAASTAYATSNSGFLYACLGIGSALSGIAYGWLPPSFRVDVRYTVFSVALVLGMAVLLPLSPWPPIGILVAGFTIAPYMITLYALTDALAPPARLPIAMAALGAGGPVGTAIGQAVTGVLIDGPGISAAWLAPTGCACVALLVALVTMRSWR
jgi:predicted MFS family arabinose efflux permease